MTTFAPQLRSALEGSLAALQRLADSQLPAPVERRMQDLGERQETLNAEEREEYAGLVEFWRQRILEKAEAAAALKRIREAAPELGSGR
jgi:hypothetical protein